MAKRLNSLILVIFCLMFSCSSPPSQKFYRIAIDSTWYPLDLMGRGPAIIGFSNDLLNAIAQRQGLILQLYHVSWDALLYSVDKGKAEAALSSILPILQYQDQYTFSTPYLLLGPVLVVRTTATADSLKELAGKEVGVLNDSPAAQIAERRGDLVVRKFSSYQLALEQLVAGQIDGALMPALLAYAYVGNMYPDVLKIGSDPLTQEGLRLLTLKNENTELIEGFDEGLAALKEEGIYTDLLKKWQLQP